jgi:Derlin-2/3
MTPLEEWYLEIPVISRIHATAIVFTYFISLIFLSTLACQLDLVSPFHLYFNWDLIYRRGEYWRLITSFLYCGGFSIDFLFHMFFLYIHFIPNTKIRVRYSRMLEEGSFRGRVSDFLYFLLLGGTAMIAATPLLTYFSISIPFLSSPLTFMLVYVWSRRNPAVRMNLLGVFTFNAPYLPWVLLGFTVLLNNVFPGGDLLGMAVAHVYYFLEDVYPRLEGSGGRRILATPGVIKYLVEDLWGRGEAGNAALPDRWAEAEIEEEPASPAAVVNEESMDEKKEAEKAKEGESSGLRQRSAVDATNQE